MRSSAQAGQVRVAYPFSASRTTNLKLIESILERRHVAVLAARDGGRGIEHRPASTGPRAPAGDDSS